jgi:uncharacterized membrane protein
MTRRFATLAKGLVLATAVTAAAERHAAADPLYSITGISPLSGTSHTLPTAINNNGQVVGVSYNTMTGNATTYAANYGEGAKFFLSSGGRTSQISTENGHPPGSINDSGQVVDGGQTINNAGYVLSDGGVKNPDGSYKDTLTYLGPNGPYEISSMGAHQINNSGLVVGSGWGGVMVYVPPGATWAEASLIHHDFAFTGPYGGTFYSGLAANLGPGTDGVAINDRGEVLTRYSVLDQNGHVTRFADLPGGANVLGVAINNNGQVVGSQVSVGLDGRPLMDSSQNYNYLKAMLYTNGKIVDLNSVIAAGSGWDLTRATGINDLGQIIGQGTYDGQEMGFVLTPTGQEVPEPGTLAFATLAILALGGRAMIGRRQASQDTGVGR